MCEVIVITSGKGGVGKTNVTANLGACLSNLGKKVLVADMDFGLRNLDVLMGLENQIVYNLVDLIEEKCCLDQVMLQDVRHENLFLLPAAQTKDSSAITPAQMKKLVEDIKQEKEFDFILLDCPSGIGQGFQNAIAPVGRALVVTTPELAAVRDADQIIGLLRKNKIFHIEVILNRIRTDMVKRGEMMSVDDITDLLPVDLIGIIPEDEQMLVAINQGEMVFDRDAVSAMAFKNIGQRICGEECPLMSLDSSKGLLKRLKTAIFNG